MLRAYLHCKARLFMDAPKELSYREIEILRCLSEGLSSKEIASRLFLAKSTVDTHRRNMIRKRAVKNTAQLLQACCEVAAGN